MQKYQDTVQRLDGRPAAGATITVTTSAGAAATLYSGNNEGQLASNTITADASGEYSFYAANGRYTLSISSHGFVADTKTDVLLFDPADAGAVDASDVAFTPAAGITSTTVQGAIAEVVSDLTGGEGASLVGFQPAGTGAVVRTAQDKMRETVSAEDYGAVGNGVTDDYAAIQAALDYLNTRGGGVLRAPATYSVSAQLRTYSGVTVDMCGTGTIRRDFNTSATGAGLFGVNGATPSNIAFVNGTLDGNGQNFNTSHNIFSGLQITGLRFDAVRLLNIVDFHAIDLAACKTVRIRDCQFLGFANLSGTRGFSEAIQLDPGYALGAGATNDDVLIEGCYAGPNPAHAAPGFGAWPCLVGNHSANDSAVVTKNIRVIGNHVEGATWAGVSAYAWDQSVISGNTFDACVRGVYLQQGTGTKTQGCVDVAITGNTFNGAATVNAVFADSNSGTPSNSIHRHISIAGNTFDGVQTCVRAYWVSGIAVTGNTARNISALYTTVAGAKNENTAITGNTIDTVSSAVIFLGGEDKNVSIVGNVARNMTGRFLHATGAGDGTLRGQLQVNSNTLVDCAGAVFVAVDSGASKDVQINGNNLSVGAAGLVPSTGEVIRCTVTGRCEVLDNYVADALIAKVVRVQAGGIFRGRVSGSPLGVVTAGIGSIAYRSDGGAGTTLYVKESGTDATGWVAK